jgi:hypothetical protein
MFFNHLNLQLKNPRLSDLLQQVRSKKNLLSQTKRQFLKNHPAISTHRKAMKLLIGYGSQHLQQGTINLINLHPSNHQMFQVKLSKDLHTPGPYKDK